jgi:hypothetical protein
MHRFLNKFIDKILIFNKIGKKKLKKVRIEGISE